MMDFQQKRKLKSVAYSRPTLVVLAIIVLLILHSTYSVYQKKTESEGAMSVALKKQMELEARLHNLNTQIETLRTDQGLEAEIRSKFNVAKENENVAVVIESGVVPPSTTTPSLWSKIIGR